MTAHRVRAMGTATNGTFDLLDTVRRWTTDSKWLTYSPPEPTRGLRFVRVDTSSSPSWVSWREIEVVNESNQRPSLRLHGTAAVLARQLGLSEFAISLSHTKEYAIAFVVGE